MARCEDAPCCGCGPEGCIDYYRVVKCKDCGKSIHPDANTETTCYACQVKGEPSLDEPCADESDSVESWYDLDY